jgi:mono/diheme cytochrome c family protein
MIRWGAAVSDSEKEPLIDYFSAHFKPKTAATAVSSSTGSVTGRQVFENKCLVCHESDLTEQQRLSRPGWTREVEKMIRWGAAVSDSEKEPLIDYLFETYGPRPLSGRK